MSFWPKDARFTLRSLVLLVVCAGLLVGAGLRLWKYYRVSGGYAAAGFRTITPQDLVRLERDATSSSPQVRLEAAIEMRKHDLETDFAMQLLKVLAKDESADVRYEAIQSMVKYGTLGKEPAPILIDALADTDARVRQQAANALGAIGPAAKAAVPSLIDLLNDSHARSSALRALSKMGPAAAPAVPAIMQFLDSDDAATCNDAVIALLQLGPISAPAVDRLIALLTANGTLTRQRAALALGQIGPAAKRAVPPLLELAQDPVFRQDAVVALGEIDSADATMLPILQQSLGHNEKSVRIVAARLTRQIGAEAAELLPDLIELLRVDPPDDEMNAVGNTIGRIGPTSIPHLRAALHYGETSRRVLAACVIAAFGADGRDAVSDLIGALQDAEPRVRAAAALALGSIGRNAAEAVAPLVACFNDSETLVRQHAAWALGDIGTDDEAAVRGLALLLHDSDENVRRIAASSLSEIHPHRDVVASEVVSFLDAAASNASRGRFEGVILMAMRGSWKDAPSATSKLIQILQQQSQLQFPQFNGFIADALIEIGPDARDAVPVIMEYLSGNYAGYEYAGRALRHIDPEAARNFVPKLVERLGQPERFMREKLNIVQCISGLGPEAASAVSCLITLLDDDQYGEVARALGEIGPAAASGVPALLGRLESGKVGNDRVYLIAIGNIGPAAKEAVPTLVQWLNDPSTMRTASFPAALFDERSARAVITSRSKYLAQALGQIGPDAREAIPKLTELSNIPDDVSTFKIPSLQFFRFDRRPLRPGEYYPGIEKSLAETAREAIRRIQSESPEARQP